MNQILVTNFKKSNIRFFKTQLLISLIILFTLICYIIYYFFLLNEEKKESTKILNNYNIYKLYANYPDIVNQKNNEIFGIIEIPKIDIYYPIFSNLTKENLKKLPCKFFGNTLKVNGNICIAGHNYNNSTFFSNITLLKINDEIFIYDNYNNKYIYKVFDVYEVKETNLSPIFNFNKYSKELTLVTCNNLNNNRIIIKAKQ